MTIAAGVNIKYNIKAVDGLSVIGGGGNYTLAGRNVGQATTVQWRRILYTCL